VIGASCTGVPSAERVINLIPLGVHIETTLYGPELLINVAVADHAWDDGVITPATKLKKKATASNQGKALRLQKIFIKDVVPVLKLYPYNFFYG
jgi:hypothetical protein